MNITKCDKCNKNRPKEEKWITENSTWLEGSAHGAGLNLRFDLCNKCNKKLAICLKKFFDVKKKKI